MTTSKLADKLALGTAQFGLPYGVSNRLGQVEAGEVELILDEARSAGVKFLDTAVAYGESERILGKFDLQDFSIVTKLPAFPLDWDCFDAIRWVEHQISFSLDRLGLTSVYGLLLHRPDQLLGPQGDKLFEGLCMLREQKLVRRIGVSIYDPSELRSLAGRFDFDLVQAPFNIFDRRLSNSGWLDRLHQAGCEVHARSVFLQGLLLMRSDERPLKFNRWSKQWDLWSQWLRETDQCPLEACLRSVLAEPRLDRVVIGVDSLAQFQKILRSAEGRFCPAPIELECSDEELLNPHLWSQL